MTYFGIDLKHLRAPQEEDRRTEIAEHLIGGLVVAIIILAMCGYVK